MYGFASNVPFDDLFCHSECSCMARLVASVVAVFVRRVSGVVEVSLFARGSLPLVGPVLEVLGARGVEGVIGLRAYPLQSATEFASLVLLLYPVA